MAARLPAADSLVVLPACHGRLPQAFTGCLVPQDPSDDPATTLLARLQDMTATYPEPEPRALAAAEPPVDRPKPATRANRRLAFGAKI